MRQLRPVANSEAEEAADARCRCVVGHDCDHDVRVVGALVCGFLGGLSCLVLGGLYAYFFLCS